MPAFCHATCVPVAFGIDLIEQVPGVGAAVGRAVDLGPAQLDVHRRAGGVVGGDRAAADRFADERGQIAGDHGAVRRQGCQRADAEHLRRSRAPPMAIVSVWLAAVTVMLPFVVSTLAVPPVRPLSALESSASVETWPTPVPKVTTRGVLAPTVICQRLPGRRHAPGSEDWSALVVPTAPCRAQSAAPAWWRASDRLVSHRRS